VQVFHDAHASLSDFYSVVRASKARIV
jgi:hypothetical protein